MNNLPIHPYYYNKCLIRPTLLSVHFSFVSRSLVSGRFSHPPWGRAAGGPLNLSLLHGKGWDEGGGRVFDTRLRRRPGTRVMDLLDKPTFGSHSTSPLPLVPHLKRGGDPPPDRVLSTRAVSHGLPLLGSSLPVSPWDRHPPLDASWSRCNPL